MIAREDLDSRQGRWGKLWSVMVSEAVRHGLNEAEWLKLFDDDELSQLRNWLASWQSLVAEETDRRQTSVGDNAE